MNSHLILRKNYQTSQRVLGQQINLIQEQNTKIISDIQNSVAKEKSDYINKAKEERAEEKSKLIGEMK